jgi:hypothetical protein
MMNRREMVALGLAGGAAGVRLPELFAASVVHPHAQLSSAEISNRYLRTRFETETGRIQAWLDSGASFLINATARAVGPDWVMTSSDSGVIRSARAEKIQDALGNGARIVAECVDQQRRVTLGIAISRYDDRVSASGSISAVRCTTASSTPTRAASRISLRVAITNTRACGIWALLAAMVIPVWP